MATERNPYEQRPEGSNVIRMEMQQPSETEATFEVDPETGEITVDLEGSAEAIEVEINMNSGFYQNLVEILDEEKLEEIGNTVLDKFEADKDSRAEWESMFERGFHLLGLKLEDTTH